MLVARKFRGRVNVDRNSESLLVDADDLYRWWSDTGATSECPCEELSFRLHELRSRVAGHLEREAASYARSGDTERHPRRPSSIVRDALLLAELDQLAMRLRLCQPGAESREAASRALKGCLRRLRGRLHRGD
jgi:hypothetical protein